MIRKTILITGASSGIGYEAATKMIEKGHQIIAPCKDLNRSEETLLRIKNNFPGKSDIESQIELPVINLSSLKSIDNFTNKIIAQGTVIDSLVLNAGLQYTGSKETRWSIDGFELTFAVNHLAHQYLTQKILPLLHSSSSPRIIITSSEVHNPESPGGKIGQLASLGELKGLINGKGFKMIDGKSVFNADKAYKDSKLCNILFGRELYRRLKLCGKPMPVIAWAPGLIIPKNNSGFFRYSRKYNELGQRLFALIARDIFKITETEDKAGKILLSLATESKYDKICFNYMSNSLVRPGKKVFEESKISIEASNDFLAKKLWEISSDLLNIDSEI